MLRAAEAVKADYPEQLELRIAEGIPFDEYVKLMEGSDAILDQLYSYTPSMNPLEAMEQGDYLYWRRRTRKLRDTKRNTATPYHQRSANLRKLLRTNKAISTPPERIPQLQQEASTTFVSTTTT